MIVKVRFVRPSGSRHVRVAKAQPGHDFRIELPHLRVGSMVWTYVNGELVDKDKVERTKACMPETPHVGLREEADADAG